MNLNGSLQLFLSLLTTILSVMCDRMSPENWIYVLGIFFNYFFIRTQIHEVHTVLQVSWRMNGTISFTSAIFSTRYKKTEIALWTELHNKWILLFGSIQLLPISTQGIPIATSIEVMRIRNHFKFGSLQLCCTFVTRTRLSHSDQSYRLKDYCSLVGFSHFVIFEQRCIVRFLKEDMSLMNNSS